MSLSPALGEDEAVALLLLLLLSCLSPDEEADVTGEMVVLPSPRVLGTDFCLKKEDYFHEKWRHSKASNVKDKFYEKEKQSSPVSHL